MPKTTNVLKAAAAAGFDLRVREGQPHHFYYFFTPNRYAYVVDQNGTAIIMAFSFDPQSTSNYYYTINSFVNCLAKEREHQSRINDEYNIN